MPLSGGDRVWIVYQGPPRFNGERWVNGDRFNLSGGKGFQCNLGVEMAPGWTGFDNEVSEERFDTPSNFPGARYTGKIANRRDLSGSINILGNNPAEWRKNKRRWERNHPDSGEPGRLWFITSDGEPRYLLARKSVEAGTGVNEKDGSIRSVSDKMDWGYSSDSPYFMGYKSSQEMKPKAGGVYSATFFNPSTAARVYPKIHLPGPGMWQVDLGGKTGKVSTPILAADEEVRLDFDPINPTFLKRNLSTGVVTNIWPLLTGSRPKLWLEPLTKNTFAVKKLAGADSATNPRFEFTPLFKSWV